MTSRDDRRPPRRRIQCGSVAGYQQHYKRGEHYCDECKAAMREYQRERARKKKVEPLGGKVRNVNVVVPESGRDDGRYPAFLRAAGRRLWDQLNSDYELTPVSEALAVEICRMKDRLERFSAALSSENQLWFELGDPEELESGEVQVSVVVNSMLGEARQTANAMSLLMKKLDVLAPAKARGGDEDPLAKLLAEVEEAANGGK